MTVPTDDMLAALASELGRKLQLAGLQLVTAESCSGGWIAKCMTDIAGSSAFFDCGMAVYSYEVRPVNHCEAMPKGWTPQDGYAEVEEPAEAPAP